MLKSSPGVGCDLIHSHTARNCQCTTTEYRISGVTLPHLPPRAAVWNRGTAEGSTTACGPNDAQYPRPHMHLRTCVTVLYVYASPDADARPESLRIRSLRSHRYGAWLEDLGTTRTIKRRFGLPETMIDHPNAVETRKPDRDRRMFSAARFARGQLHLSRGRKFCRCSNDFLCNTVYYE